MFSFNKKTIEFLKAIQCTKKTILSDIQNLLESKKLSKSQKKRILFAQDMLNIQNPNMCNEIGKTLNRIFIKDIALNITEFI